VTNPEGRMPRRPAGRSVRPRAFPVSDALRTPLRRTPGPGWPTARGWRTSTSRGRPGCPVCPPAEPCDGDRL